MRRLFFLVALLLLAPAARAGGFEDEVSYQGRTLKAWLDDLRSKDAETRAYASRVLRGVGPEADGATAALLLALKTNEQTIRDNDDFITRTRVAAVLARLGPKQVPALAVALGLDDAGITYGVARALAFLGPQAKAAAPHLARQLKSPTPRLRIVSALALYRIDRRPAAVAVLRKELGGSGDDLAWAAWALEQCGPDAADAAPELVKQLTHPSEFTRRYAFFALESIGKPAVVPLVKALESDNARLRVEAAEALGRIGPEADDAVPALIALTRGAPAGPRAAAVRALGRIGSGDEKTTAALERSLRDSDVDVRREAASALKRLGPLASADALCAALRDDDRPTRLAAAAALKRIGTPAVRPLVGVLKDNDELARRQALDCLAALAPDADAFIALTAVARDPRDVLRSRTVEALASFGVSAVPTLGASLGDASVRPEAAAALARLGADAAGAREALIAVLPLADAIVALGHVGDSESVAALVKLDGDAERPAVLVALARAPGEAKQWLPFARKALKDARAPVRLAALLALAAAGAEAKGAAADVVALLKDEAAVRLAAGRVLVLLGEGKTLLPHAKDLLDAEDAAARRTALDWAAWLGPAAKELRRAVAARLDDGDADVRLAAVAALLEIEADDSGTSTLAAMLKDEVRKPALFALAGRRPTDLLSPLTAVAGGDELLPARLGAARALGAMGAGAKESVPALLNLLLALDRLPDETELMMHDRFVQRGELTIRRGRGLDEADVSADVAAAVRAIGRNGLEALDDFRRVMNRLREAEQADVLDQLARIGPDAVGEIVKHLESDSAERRRLAARVLARLGKVAKHAAPALRAMLKDGDVLAAVEAARALVAVTGETDAVVGVLRASLDAPGEAAIRAAVGLADLGAAAKPAVDELLRAATSREARLRRAAVAALGACGADAKAVRPLLLRRLRDEAEGVRIAAALALERLDKRDPVPELIRAVRFGEDRAARLDAIASLAGRADKAALPALRAAIRESSPELRTAAALAVQKLGGSQAGVADVLLGVATSPTVRPAVRIAALRGVGRATYALTEVARDAATPTDVREAARAALARE